MTDQYGERGPWHSGDEKPEIDGVWERDYSGVINPYDASIGVVFSMFENKKWLVFGEYANDAECQTAISSYQNLRWRGLANKP